jgi:hypothetical protein
MVGHVPWPWQFSAPGGKLQADGADNDVARAVGNQWNQEDQRDQWFEGLRITGGADNDTTWAERITGIGGISEISGSMGFRITDSADNDVARAVGNQWNQKEQ